MIPGTPLLATYDATGVIRVFEYTGGVFTQMASQGGFAQDPSPPGGEYPFMAWAGQRIVLVRSTGLFNRTHQLLDFLLGSVASSDAPAGGVGDSYRVGFAKDARVVAMMGSAGLDASAAKRDVADEGFTVETHAAMPSNSPGLVSVPVSADGGKWPLLLGTSIKNVINPGQDQAFVQKGIAAIRADYGAWDATGGYLVVGKVGDNYATVLRYDAARDEGFEEMLRLEDAGGFAAIAAAPYGKSLAIGWLSGGDYTTGVYRRVGPFYQLEQTLTGMGKLLAFNGDGTLLLDGALRKVALYDEGTDLFVDAPGAVVNLPTGTVVQALSDHVPVTRGLTNTYPIAAKTMVEGGFDTNALKLTLATSAAPNFDNSHTTLAQALGSAEVSTGQWPAGGVALTGATVAMSNGVVAIDSDDIERIAITSGIVFRFAFLHANGVPVVRYDFQQNVTVQEDRKISFAIPAAGVLNIFA